MKQQSSTNAVHPAGKPVTGIRNGRDVSIPLLTIIAFLLAWFILRPAKPLEPHATDFSRVPPPTIHPASQP